MSLAEFQGASALLVVTLAVLVHHYAFGVERLQMMWGERLAEKSVYGHRVMGFVVLGLIPYLFAVPLSLPNGGVAPLELDVIAAVTCSFCLVSAVVIWSAPVNDALLSHYPMVRKEVWTPATHAVSAMTWFLFLMGYEYMYRGFLLFTLVDSIGPVLAVAVSTSLYALHHLPKAGDEAFISVIFGVVLGCLALWSGGFWPAFVLHLVVAVVGEYGFLKAHPLIRGKQ